MGHRLCSFTCISQVLVVSTQDVREDRMRSIAKLYLAYLEMAVIGMVLVSLALISLAGFIYGGKGLPPAALAVVTLGFIVYVATGRRRTLDEHPELRRKLFGETRLFFFGLNGIVLKMTDSQASGPFLDSFHWSSRKQAIQQSLSRIAAIMIVALTIWTLWSSFSISADIATQKNLEKNQAIVAAGLGVPATVFNRAIVIELIQISAETLPKVTAVIHSDGYPDAKIENEGVGYEMHVARNQFIIRIQRIDNSSAEFFVERIVN